MLAEFEQLSWNPKCESKRTEKDKEGRKKVKGTKEKFKVAGKQLKSVEELQKRSE